MSFETILLKRGKPALILAPMDGLSDAPMRELVGETGAFAFGVSEFLRVSADVPPAKMFYRDVPELLNGSATCSGMPVQVQLLGGHAGRMAQAAAVACDAGACGIDINFGCPAPTVNRHDGGASLLNYPRRIREIVRAMRDAVPSHIPVSAKLRLGWDSQDVVIENAEMAAEGGADWVTIHGRTRVQGYKPPVYWGPIGAVRERLDVPVVANGDIWSLDDLRRCREETGCDHFMLGRGALADPRFPARAARELGISSREPVCDFGLPFDWLPPLRRLVVLTERHSPGASKVVLCRLKQWLKIASLHGEFQWFDRIKRAESAEELFETLAACMVGQAHDPWAGVAGARAAVLAA